MIILINNVVPSFLWFVCYLLWNDKLHFLCIFLSKGIIALVDYPDDEEEEEDESEEASPAKRPRLNAAS